MSEVVKYLVDNDATCSAPYDEDLELYLRVYLRAFPSATADSYSSAVAKLKVNLQNFVNNSGFPTAKPIVEAVDLRAVQHLIAGWLALAHVSKASPPLKLDEGLEGILNYVTSLEGAPS